MKSSTATATAAAPGLPEDVRMYLSRTALLLRSGEVDLQGADAFLLDAVLRATDGLEVELLSDKRASKAFEPVLRACDAHHVQTFLHRLML